MDAVKLWKVSDLQGNLIIKGVPDASQAKTEAILEEILIKAPNLLFDDLELVGRQLETPAGTLDLLGVKDGHLLVFELKRSILTRKAVAQIIDYASYLAELDVPALSALISQGSGKNGIDKIDDFEQWYSQRFGEDLEAVKPRMVLVGLGVDENARRMVEFLASANIDIQLLTFHGFYDQDGSMYLAKQVEVSERPAAEPGKISKQTNQQALERKIEASKVGSFFDRVAKFLRSELINAYEWPNQNGYGYYLQDTTDSGKPTNHSYILLTIPDQPKGALLLTFWERAVRAAGDEWSRAVQAWGSRVAKKKNYFELKIPSEKEWNVLEPEFHKVCTAIVRGRQTLREQQIAAERLALKEDTTDAVNEAPPTEN